MTDLGSFSPDEHMYLSKRNSITHEKDETQLQTHLHKDTHVFDAHKDTHVQQHENTHTCIPFWLVQGKINLSRLPLRETVPIHIDTILCRIHFSLHCTPPQKCFSHKITFHYLTLHNKQDLKATIHDMMNEEIKQT